MTGEAVLCASPKFSSQYPRLKSCLCTQAQLETPPFREWSRRMRLQFKHHRKLWEFAFIAEALEQHGMLRPGRRGLGFAVGREPLAALFASRGCEIVATDLDERQAGKLGWTASNQHAARLEDLNTDGLCDPDEFRRLVTFRPVDMNDIPDDLEGFDFVWSSCSFEHLGSIAHGRRFIDRMTRCLKPDGIAVHTTEFNVSSNSATIDNDPTFVIFRQRDIEEMAADLRSKGRGVELDLTLGNGPADAHVDLYPYEQKTHLKLQLGSFVATSFGLIAGPVGSHPPADLTRGSHPKQEVAAEWARRSRAQPAGRKNGLRPLAALHATYKMRVPKVIQSIVRRVRLIGRTTPAAAIAPVSQPADAGNGRIVFAVAPGKAVRVPSAAGPKAGFFCPPAQDLPADDYTCEFDLEVPASEATVTVAVLIRAGENWRSLNESSWSGTAYSGKTLRLSFRIEKAGPVAFHAHVDRGFAESSFLGLKVLMPAGVSFLERTSLPMVLPEPYTTWPPERVRFVVIGTTAICNASCAHCPTNKEHTKHLPKKVMALDLFEKLLREIRDSHIPVDGHLSFGLYAEPLLDPLVIQRAALVKAYLPDIRLTIASNGGPLTDELSVSLSPYVDFFCIHIEALTPALYHELMPPLRAETVFPKVEQLIRLSNKPVWIVCPTHKKNVHEVEDLGKYWMVRGATRFVPTGFSNRCTDILRADEFLLETRRGDCSEQIASDLIIDWDGAVLGCCQDFLKRNQIGDLRTQTLQQVLTSPERKKLFDGMRTGTRDDFVSCRSCYFDSEEVLERELQKHKKAALAH